MEETEHGGPGRTGRDNGPAPDDSRLIRALEEYLADLRAGRRPDRRAFLERHPDLAPDLAGCLEGLEILRPPVPPPPGPGAPSGPAEVGFRNVVLGDYRLLREVGRGGMGVVYEAEQVSLGRRVALKVLPFAAALDPKRLQRFQNEAQVVARLQHPHVVPVYAVGRERGVHYYAMQFIDGRTLTHVIRELRWLSRAETPGRHPLSGEVTRPETGAEPRREGSPRPPAFEAPASPFGETLSPPVGALFSDASTRSAAYFRTVARLGAQAADALDHVHHLGVVHRDVKPSNLLVDGQGHLWITDFGLAQFQSGSGLTMTGDLVGTLRYMSPEQALAKRVLIDHRTDVYSLGVTLYELLTLQHAFSGRDREELLRQIAFEEPRRPRRVNRAIPAELETIVLKAMAKNPAERYASAGELADDLRRFLEDRPIRAKRPSLLRRARKWIRRRPLVASLTGLALLLGAILAIAAGLLTHERGQGAAGRYRSLVQEAQAVRLARKAGFRSRALALVAEAARLDGPGAEVHKLRRLAASCLGDVNGLEPVALTLPRPVRSVALHPGGELLAVGLDDGALLLRPLPAGPERRLAGHRGDVVGLAFATAGNLLVSADAGGTIRTWEANATGEWTTSRTLTAALPALNGGRGRSAEVSLAVTPDGRLLAAGARQSSTISLWDLGTGKKTATFSTGKDVPLRGLALSPDGRLLAAACEPGPGRGGVLLWQVDQPQGAPATNLRLTATHAVAFSSDGSLLACAGGNGTMVLIGPGLRQFVAADRAIVSLRDPTEAVCFTQDQRLFSLTRDGTFKVWNLIVTPDRKVQIQSGLLGPPDPPSQPATAHLAAVSASGRVAMRARGATAALWDLGEAAEKTVTAGHASEVTDLAFAPTGPWLVSASEDGTARTWDAASGRLLQTLTGFNGPLHAVAWSPDGRLLATADAKGTLRLWDAGSWQGGNSLDMELGPPLHGLRFSPDGHTFAAAGERGVRLWRIVPDPTEGKAGLVLQPLARLTEGRAEALVFDRAGTRLAWVTDGTLHLWDVANARELSAPPVHFASGGPALAFLRGGDRLAVIGATGEIEGWDVSTGRPTTPTPPGRFSGPLAVSGDGRRLAGLVPGEGIVVWDVEDERLLVTLPEGRVTVNHLAWSPDHELLAVGSTQGVLVIWNLPRVRTALAEIGLGW